MSALKTVWEQSSKVTQSFLPCECIFHCLIQKASWQKGPQSELGETKFHEHCGVNVFSTVTCDQTSLRLQHLRNDNSHRVWWPAGLSTTSWNIWQLFVVAIQQIIPRHKPFCFSPKWVDTDWRENACHTNIWGPKKVIFSEHTQLEDTQPQKILLKSWEK